jgi:hypothetical protein
VESMNQDCQSPSVVAHGTAGRPMLTVDRSAFLNFWRAGWIFVLNLGRLM